MHEALFYKARPDGHLQCELCPRECVLKDGQVGACGVRKAEGGKLYAMTYAHPCSLAIDPVEKKPLFHFHPGEQIFSLATIGCNLFCDFCQNWQISKEKWDEARTELEVPPAKIIALAKERDCRLIAFTYTEPTVFFEYAIDIAKLAKKRKMECVIVSNGYIGEKPALMLAKYIKAANIDLKGGPAFYRQRCKVPEMEPIKETIVRLKRAGVHVEVTTLLIPGENDSEREIEANAKWLAKEAGRDTPLHLSAFHPDYKLLEKEATPAKALLRAREIASRHLDFVYVGNIAGARGAPGAGIRGIPCADNNTYCPECRTVVIEREFYQGVSRLKDGKCPKCGEKIAGVFSQ